MNRLFWSRWFIFPDEIDQILRGVDEPGTLGRELVIELDGFSVANRASVNADTTVLGAIDKPFGPVFRAICMTDPDKVPV